MSSNRIAILESARDLCIEEGARGVSMRKVAKRVGISATAIYRHFKNKEDMLNSVTEEGRRVFGNTLARALVGETPQERMILTGDAYVDFALEQTKYYEMIFMMPEMLRKDASVDFTKYTQDITFRFLVDRVRECMGVGLFRQDDPEEVAATLWAHLHGMVSIHLCHNNMDPTEFRAKFHESSARIMIGMSAPLRETGDTEAPSSASVAPSQELETPAIWTAD